MRIPGSTTNGAAAIGVLEVDEQLAAVAANRRAPGELTIVMPCLAASPERGCTKPA